MIIPSLTIAPSGKKGRGVFTMTDIPANTVIEISPVIVLNSKERALVEKTKLYNYIFEWGITKKMACIALGYVSLYNHDYNANCDYEMDFEHKLISIRTIKEIRKGEELFVNYNANPSDKTKIWFNAK
jgi:uncharacterized protein